MTAQAASAHEHKHGEGSGAHSPKHYVKIWAILVVLLFVSVAGPELGIQVVTLITAFGVAAVKAYLVAAHFMHLNVEKRYATYLLTTAVVLMVVFFAGTAPDVMNHDGDQWENVDAKAETQRALEAEKAAGGGHH